MSSIHTGDKVKKGADAQKMKEKKLTAAFFFFFPSQKTVPNAKCPIRNFPGLLISCSGILLK